MHAFSRSRLVALALLAGCAHCETGGGQTITVKLLAGPKLNPGEDGQSLPTSVRLYQLRSADKIKNADLTTLLRGDKEALGEDLIKVDQFTISAGEKQKHFVVIDPPTKVLAAVAVVRLPSGATWRALVDVPIDSYASQNENNDDWGSQNNEDEGDVVTFDLKEYGITRH